MNNIVEINGKRYKAGDWKIWNGGENPVPGKLVQWQLARDTRAEILEYEPVESVHLRWNHCTKLKTNIVCYRVMEEVKPEVVEVVRWVEVDSIIYQGVCHTINLRKESIAKITYNLVDGVPDPKSIKMELV